MKNTITVLGKAISYEIKDIDISKLEYYPDNPRINYIINKQLKGKINQELIQYELLNMQQTKDRMKDLENNKGLLDEVYVLKNQVVEGNTRLCAFRRLSQKHPDDKRWKTIKARVLQENVTEEELFYILGTFHLKGKTEWDAFEKAAYIHKMIVVLKKNNDEIAEELNMQKKTLEASLKAYKTMIKKYLPKIKKSKTERKNDEIKKFSYFNAFYLQKDLVERVENTPKFEDTFVEWVIEERFNNAQGVRNLPKILKNNRALKIFKESEPEIAYDEAMQILYQDKPGEVNRFYKKFEDFAHFLDNVEIKKIKEEINESRQKKHVIVSCYKKFSKFLLACGLDI
jgi:hypothetical protein